MEAAVLRARLRAAPHVGGAHDGRGANVMVRLRTTRFRAVGRGTDEDFAVAAAELVRGRYDTLREECGRSQCRGAFFCQERATTLASEIAATCMLGAVRTV